MATPMAERLLSVISKDIELNLDESSYAIFLVKRMNDHDFFRASVEPITTSVKSELQKRIREQERRDQIHLYNYLASVGRSSWTMGILFGLLAKVKLQPRVALELLPMVKWISDESTNSSQESGRKKSPQWRSNHKKNTDLSSQLDRISINKF
jgi:hypothetical protein